MPSSETADYIKRKNLTYENQIKETTLLQMAAPTTATFLRQDKAPINDRTILKGNISNNRYSSSLQVHATDTIEVHNHHAEAMVGPSLKICLITHGRIEGTLGDASYCLDANNGPKGYIWALSQPTLWTRQMRKGTKVSKIIISADFNWIETYIDQDIESSSRIQEFLHGKLDIRNWKPSKRAIALAGKLITPQTSSPIIKKLQAESHALEILAEALKSILSSQSMSSDVKEDAPQEHKARIVREYIEDNVHEGLNLDTISTVLAMSKSSLQKSFKIAYGMTVMDYVRERRLVTARDAIEQDNITISQAAFLAGYNSAANFSTAFKRVFGFSPSDLTAE
ncbi:helix-turn-helix domain-containing protein [Kiloniella litopenaei]|uniref:helix-turn-helix domain-containing protein n=1 Tax=Kiloniella litopenaei TaxID=1549748 RepID=UPI003BAAAA0E